MGEHKPELVERVARVMRSSIAGRNGNARPRLEDLHAKHREDYVIAASSVLDELQAYAGEVAPGIAKELEQAKAEVVRLTCLCQAHETQIKGLEKKNKRLTALVTTLEERQEEARALAVAAELRAGDLNNENNQLTSQVERLSADAANVERLNKECEDTRQRATLAESKCGEIDHISRLVMGFESVNGSLAGRVSTAVSNLRSARASLALIAQAALRTSPGDAFTITQILDAIGALRLQRPANGLVQVVSIATLGALVDAIAASARLAEMPSALQSTATNQAITRAREAIAAEAAHV